MTQPYTIGQTIYYVDTTLHVKSTPQPVTITKIGTKWLELSNKRRADKNTLIVDGKQYTSPGRCYIDLAAYQHKEKLEKAWAKLRVAMRNSTSYQPPTHLTAEDMEAIATKLTPPTP